MESPQQPTKSRIRRVRRDAQLRKALMSDYGSSTPKTLGERKGEGNTSIPRMSGTRKLKGPSGTKKTVMRLRPSKALTLPCSISVQEASRKMGAAHVDAALVTLNGEVCGIITDSDITRRVVAAGKKASSTPVSLVMTGSPCTMKPTDPAFDALSMMVDKHFRHMPVIRNKSSVVGLLDINKCLSNALKSNANSDALKSGLLSGLHLSLEETIEAQGKEAPWVYDKDPVIEAAKVMANTRKTAVLIKDSTMKTVGILTTKDVMLRVVAARLMPGSTTVARVMTPHPDTVPCTWSVEQALKQMRTKRYLHLPVADEAGDVMGLVDALELCMVVLKPESVDKENAENADNDDNLRGILEGLWQGDSSTGCGSDTESITGSITGDSRIGTPNRSRASSVVRGANALSLTAGGMSVPPLALGGVQEGSENASVRSSILPPINGDVKQQCSAASVASAPAPRVRKDEGSVMAHMEACVGGLEKGINARNRSALNSLEGRISEGMALLHQRIESRISREMSDLKKCIEMYKWNVQNALSSGQNPPAIDRTLVAKLAKLEGLPGSVRDELKSVGENMSSKLTRMMEQIQKKDTTTNAQMEVIRNLTSSLGQMPRHTGAAPLAVQSLMDLMAKNTAVFQENSRILRSDISTCVDKIEKMVEDNKLSMKRFSRTSEDIPTIVRDAVVRAQRNAYSPPPKRHSSSDSKEGILEACKSIAEQAAGVVKEKLSSVFGGQAEANEKVAVSQDKLMEKFAALEAGLTSSIDDRVKARVENQLIKVGGASAVGGMVLGVLSAFFMRK